MCGTDGRRAQRPGPAPLLPQRSLPRTPPLRPPSGRQRASPIALPGGRSAWLAGSLPRLKGRRAGDEDTRTSAGGTKGERTIVPPPFPHPLVGVCVHARLVRGRQVASDSAPGPGRAGGQGAACGQGQDSELLLARAGTDDAPSARHRGLRSSSEGSSALGGMRPSALRLCSGEGRRARGWGPREAGRARWLAGLREGRAAAAASSLGKVAAGVTRATGAVTRAASHGPEASVRVAMSPP